MTTFLVVLLVASLCAFAFAWMELDKIEAHYGSFKAPFYTPTWVRVMGILGMIGFISSIIGLLFQWIAG